jgi:hypothetical protein
LGVLLPLLIVVPIVGLLTLILGTSPRSYTIANGTLIVRSGDSFAGTRTVRLADVRDVRIVSLHGGRRTAGTAMPGYCTGRFSYPEFGSVWQVTRCGPTGVLVEATSEAHPILIAPDDPSDFVARIRTGTETAIVLPPPDLGPIRIVLGGIAIAALASAALLFALLLFGPSAMRYRVGDGVLEVRTLFGRKRWPISGASAKGHTPARLRRLVGTAVPGYHTGLYRESGATTRVYATDLTRVVLFDGPARVILSPENRVEMLRALEAEGARVIHHA